MHGYILSFALAVVAASPPPEGRGTPDEPRPGGASALKKTVDALWKDAAVGADADYQKLINQATADSPAPLDMRKLIVGWPEPRNLRGWPQQMGVSFEGERLTVSWNAEIGCGEEAEAASKRFAAALAKQGYRPLTKSELEAFLKTQAQPTERRAVYRRQTGETELLASFEATDYTGSSTYHSGVRFTWLARRQFKDPQPFLSEVFRVFPAWIKAKYLDEKFFAALADEPVAALTSGRDITISFARPISDKVVRALEQTGFEYQREASPGRDGSLQKTWYRYTDITFAHVIMAAGGKSVRFHCQMPQHKGDAIKVKPPALHPSLRLPPEKRPVLKFDELKFSDGTVERQAHLFQDLAEKTAQKNWHVQLYKDSRHSADPRYTASWQTSPVNSTAIILKNRLYRGITISLTGKHSDGADHLDSLYVGGVSAPVKGWAAQVSYSVNPSRDGISRPTLSATAALAREDGALSFDHSHGSTAIPLMQRFLTASVNESREASYTFQTQVPAFDFARSLALVCGTPEHLRDEVLADIAALRKHARQQIEAGESLKYYDMTDVRSDNPPREAPASLRPPTAKTKETLLAQIESHLSSQETTLRDHFRDIHAAAQQALPLEALRKELLPAAAP